MKRVLSALLLSVLCFSLYAEEIEFHALYSHRGTDGVNAAYFFHDKAIIEHTHDSGKLEEYDFSTRTLKVVPIDEKVHVLGQQGPKLLFWYDTEDSEGMSARRLN